MMAEEGEAAPAAAAQEAVSDFTEDLLEALTTDDEPLVDFDEPAQFFEKGAVGEGIDALESQGSWKNAQAVEALRAKYALHETDTGSSQVQIAVLTARIAYMTKHMQENKKDYASLRGLTAMVTRRRKLLEYLLREDFPEFKRLTSELGTSLVVALTRSAILRILSRLLATRAQGQVGRRVSRNHVGRTLGASRVGASDAGLHPPAAKGATR